MYLRHNGSSLAEHGKCLKAQLDAIEKMEKAKVDRKQTEHDEEKNPSKKPNNNSTPKKVPRGDGSNDHSDNQLATKLFK